MLDKVAPISLCMIVRDEELQLENCLKSIRPYVKELVIVDTGSVDSTPQIAQKYADIYKVFTDCNNPVTGLIEDFAMARQYSFDLATQPWVMWIDGDDEVVGADKLYKLVEKVSYADESNPVFIILPYDYSQDENGNSNCYQYRERIINPASSFKWVNPVHEVIIPKPGQRVTHVESDNDLIKIVHKRGSINKKCEIGRNLRILKKLYEREGEKDARHLYYLGLEYANNNEIDNALKFLIRYTELSGWDDEKALAALKISELYYQSDNINEAIVWALKTITIKENWGEPYFALSKYHYYLAAANATNERRNWEKCVYFARTGLAFPPTKTLLFINPKERDVEIHIYLNMALNKLGRVEEALESVNCALQKDPNNGNLLLNKRLYEAFLNKATVKSSLNKLFEMNEISNDIVLEICNLLDNKKEIKIESKPETIKEVITEQIKQNNVEKLNICFFVGRGAERWTPESAKKNGIGGSETAVIEMGRLLAKRGHEITVYGDCEDMEGVYDGVQYLDAPKFRDIRCDILIASRRPDAFDDIYNVQGKVQILWIHDVHCGSALSHERMLKIDKIFCLTNWHKNNVLETYNYVTEDQIIVTRNGINIERFNQKIKRNPHKAVYSSSPDRGMEVVVRVWPKIRERVPDAELHVYYGFQTWETTSDKGQLELIATLKKLLKDNEKYGVVYHGRVDQETLAKEYLSAGVWPYSTWFSESSCITAMEAHAAGLRMVTSPTAALTETVGERGMLIEGDWLSQEYQSKFIDAVCEQMLKAGDEDRVALQQYAKAHFTWSSLSEDWEKMFFELKDYLKENPLMPYVGCKRDSLME